MIYLWHLKGPGAAPLMSPDAAATGRHRCPDVTRRCFLSDPCGDNSERGGHCMGKFLIPTAGVGVGVWSSRTISSGSVHQIKLYP